MDIRSKILSLARKKNNFLSGDVAENLDVSRQYAQRILKQLTEEGLLVKSGSTRGAWYALPEFAGQIQWKYDKRFRNKDLAEHAVLEDVEQRSPFRQSLAEHLRSIFDYAFSEMLNNAIEHSTSKNIHVAVEKRDGNLVFMVNDFGIGVFRNIMRKRKLKSALEAIQDLLKGKTTTAPMAHSGEGIFFTSKVADIFSLESFGKKLTINNLISDIFIEDVKPSKKGTKVFFQIASNSKKHLNKIFRQYQTDPTEYAFDKTEIQIKLYTLGTVHVSRSQARRVLSGLEKFKSIVFDFKNVPTIGQAFADEIFRVFKNSHPDIQLTPVHMNETVRFWVERVEK
jgi:anti-sigma regulatory factor (Ser/Thr protein kinase)/biotin operon repressor